MNRSNQDLKHDSLEMLNGKWVPTLFVCLIVWFFASSADTFTSTSVQEIYRDGQVIRQTVENRSSILSLINFFFAGPVYFGLAAYFLRLKRYGETEINEVLAGLGNFFKYFLANLVMVVLILLWTLLLIVPGIIAYYRYSMTWYILNDHPELTVMQAIQRSKEMMAGNKMDLFSLQISFIGWAILALFTMGIGFIPLNAYYNGAKVHFYEELSGHIGYIDYDDDENDYEEDDDYL